MISEQRQQQLAKITKDALPDFGLRVGAIRAKDLVHNGGWYNGLGQKIGWGDLSVEDIKRIQSKLQPEELFVVLPERASYWDFVEHLPDNKMQLDAKAAHPGIEYIVEHAHWLITPATIYHKNYTNEAGEHDGLQYQSLVPELFLKLLEGT